MMLYDSMFKHAVKNESSFVAWEKGYRGLPVYDLSSIVKLALDSGGNGGIPAKMPHDRLWIEMDVIGRRFGVALHTMPAQPSPVICVHSGEPCPIHVGMKLYCGDETDHPRLLPFLVCAGISNDWTRITVSRFTGKPAIDALGVGVFNPSEVEKDEDIIMRVCLIPWLCFRLLHCRNVVTEDVKQTKLHGRVKGEREHRPWCTYKVLKLEVPGRRAERNSDAVEGGATDDESKMRFHLCRGHFKNLQHDRYKQKGWHWWPAHWRGDIELGRADKRYTLESAK